MIGRILAKLALFAAQLSKWAIIGLLFAIVVLPFLGIFGAKYYQGRDKDPDRGAIAMADGAFGESYSKPTYLDQGWDANDSLWFYNTTQGSGLLPYDFFLVLQQAGSTELLRSNKNMDRFRYLPQKDTIFNPDALPVGFTKETYQGNDYVGYTCAACHTAQINFKKPGEEKSRALRIDGGPAMADMVTFLKELQEALVAAQTGPKGEQFVGDVLALENDYGSREEVKNDLEKWTRVVKLYNTVNNSTFEGKKIEYGHARLDAFGRIYNRVLQHLINKNQFAQILEGLKSATGRPLLTEKQIDNVLEGIDETIIGDEQFALILERLEQAQPKYPDLSRTDMLRVRNKIFNPPNAPVSYPFLWDIAQSDYVQWNGIASNAAVGPIGRNAGEVIGVFGILDWKEDKSWFELSAWLRRFSLSRLLSGQTNKRKVIDFDSSIDLFNLGRLERHLSRLKSPQWPEKILGRIDKKSAALGKPIYEKLCQSCHEVIDRNNSERKVIAKMLKVKKAGTDPAMAKNSVTYAGKAGNFKHTYQATGVGDILVPEEAPVAVLLTAATKGVVATPDPDKWFLRRWVEWIYTLVSSFFDNDIKASVKSGNYEPDTTQNPFASLVSYKARSLNGIWATAPYLHNGSVPSLYDLLLPVKCKEDVGDGKRRPTTFMVGAREFDPKKVGFRSEGYKGFKFRTELRGNHNTGHQYGACRMTDEERWHLIEYMKTL